GKIREYKHLFRHKGGLREYQSYQPSSPENGESDFPLLVLLVV
ncbi:hypothetical protein NT04LM_1564, partial [Listeria monocytogenes FSL F2-208]